MAKHLIYKQKVTLHLSKKNEVHALQDKVSMLLQSGLMDGLEAVLDSAFPPDKVVRIDKLQLDLGVISVKNFESEFKTQFIKSLSMSLAVKAGSLDGPKGGEAIFTKAQATENILIFFLENGHLPWYGQTNRRADWEKEILGNLSAVEYRHFFKWLKDNYRARPVIIERLILQFSDNFIGELLIAMAPVFNESWELILADYLSVITDYTSAGNKEQSADFDDSSKTDNLNPGLCRLAARDKVWQYSVQSLLEYVNNDPALRILELLFEYVGVAGEKFNAMRANNIGTALKTNTVKLAFVKFAEFFKTEKGSFRRENEGNEDKAPSSQKEDGHIENKTNRTPGKLKIIEKRGVSITKNTGLNEGDVVYVNNCGIVMLHPFLKPFFEEMDLTVGGEFLSKDARARSVLLLHYIATGETEMAEFDLTLQKILCGYSLGDTLPSQIILANKERIEIDNLLKAVLGHWEPLKNTSIEGFRSTFLQRPGSLKLKGSGWLLTVEQKTIDILLGKLPWGFSTIRMPWMQDALSVDWY